MNFIDTSRSTGAACRRCCSALRHQEIPRDSYLLGSKLGATAGNTSTSPPDAWSKASTSALERMGVDHLDVMLCHDIEFVDAGRSSTRRSPRHAAGAAAGKVRFIEIGNYPMKIFKYVLDQQPLDVILSYNHYTLQNTMLAELVPYLKGKGVGIMERRPVLRAAADERARRNGTRPRRRSQGRRQGRRPCEQQGIRHRPLALQFSIRHEDMAACIVGSAKRRTSASGWRGRGSRSTNSSCGKCRRSSGRSRLVLRGGAAGEQR